MATVDVQVDKAPARLGTLSYRLPSAMSDVSPGTAVEVPFGKSLRHGMVIGPGDVSKATREVAKVHGRRAHEGDVTAAVRLAKRNMCSASSLFTRFAPKSHKGAEPADSGPVELVDGLPQTEFMGGESRSRSVVVPPSVAMAAAAAQRSALLASSGQVLVLCPTVQLVREVLRCFNSGAERLDAKAERGTWKGFVEGTVKIGVATRAGAWFSPKNLAGIVVVDAEHPGHVAPTLPYVHSRDVALERAADRGVPVELLVAAPSAVTLASGKMWVSKTPAPPVNAVTRDASGQIPNAVKVAAAKVTRRGGKVLVVTAESPPKRRCSSCNAECGCPVSACPHDQCLKCGEKVFTAGWTDERVRRLFGPQATAVKPSELREGVTGFDIAVVTNADAALRSPSLEPEASMWRFVAAAQSAATEVWAIVDDPSHDLMAALKTGSERAAARVVWAAAKERSMPPFGLLVSVEFTSSTPPKGLRFPGRVAGPRPTAPGSWKALVVCQPSDLPAVERGLTALRSAGSKVRFTVTAPPPNR